MRRVAVRVNASPPGYRPADAGPVHRASAPTSNSFGASACAPGTAEAARRLGIHPVSVARLIREGRLPAEKVGKTWVVTEADLEAFARGYRARRGRSPRRKEGSV